MIAPYDGGETPAGAGEADGGARSFTIGLVAQHAAGGLRAQLDVVEHGGWTLGAGLHVSIGSKAGDPDLRAVRGVGLLARTLSGTRWSLRLQGGLGALVYGTIDGHTLPIAEVSALVGRDVGRNWSIVGGPIVTWLLRKQDPAEGLQARPLLPDVEGMVLGGLRRRF
ncbi:MAG: hypothetical protein KF773_27720 [Deltaproteobacteria bacterium]|nr:hypothetical protein [Deltaproteobacteria bacterium]